MVNYLCNTLFNDVHCIKSLVYLKIFHLDIVLLIKLKICQNVTMCKVVLLLPWRLPKITKCD